VARFILSGTLGTKQAEGQFKHYFFKYLLTSMLWILAMVS